MISKRLAGQIPRFKGVLFDMDGVILDSMPYHFQAWQGIFLSLGIHLNKYDVYEREGEQGIASLSALLSRYGLDLSDEELKGMLKEKEELFKKIAVPRLFPGVEELLNTLKGKGYLLGLVTGTSKDELEHILPLSLLKTFEIIVTGDGVARGKPHPEPYLKAIKGLRISEKEVVVIENAPFGIISAKKAGAFCIAITSSLPAEYVKEADIICDSLQEIRELILEKRDTIQVQE